MGVEYDIVDAKNHRTFDLDKNPEIADAVELCVGPFRVAQALLAQGRIAKHETRIITHRSRQRLDAVIKSRFGDFIRNELYQAERGPDGGVGEDG